MVQVQNGKATGTLAEILGYAFAASLAGMTADPSDVLG